MPAAAGMVPDPPTIKTGFQKETAMDSDVRITIVNRTDQNTHALVFEQNPDLHQIFVSVFPTAWKVFDLGRAPKNGEPGGTGSVILPRKYHIGASDTKDAFQGTVSYQRETATGKKWKFVKEDDFYLIKENGAMSDHSMGCTNDTGGYAALSLVKNDSPLLTYGQVGQKAMAVFKPIEYIYVAWYTEIVQGSKIQASIGSPQAVGISLDGAKDVMAALHKNANTGERTWKVKVNGVDVPMASQAIGLRPAFTVTLPVAA
jgi:hypothetical protein